MDSRLDLLRSKYPEPEDGPTTHPRLTRLAARFPMVKPGVTMLRDRVGERADAAMVGGLPDVPQLPVRPSIPVMSGRPGGPLDALDTLPALMDRLGARADATMAVNVPEQFPERESIPVMRARDTQAPTSADAYNAARASHQPGRLETFARKLQGALTLGMGDRGTSAVRAALGPNTYGEEIGSERGITRRGAEENPVSAFAGDALGSGLFANRVLKGAEGAVTGGGRLAQLLFPAKDASMGKRIAANYLGGGSGPLLDAGYALSEDGTLADKARSFALNSAFSAAGGAVVEGGARAWQNRPRSAVTVPPAAPRGVTAQVEPLDYLAAVDEFAQARPDGMGFVTRQDITGDETKRAFLAPGGKSGYILQAQDDGVDIQGLFSFGEKGAGTVSLMDAIRNGGTKLDNYDTGLGDLYEAAGFRVTQDLPFDPQYSTLDPKFGTPNYTYRELDPRAAEMIRGMDPELAAAAVNDARKNGTTILGEPLRATSSKAKLGGEAPAPAMPSPGAMFPDVPTVKPARVTKAGRVMGYAGGDTKFKSWALDRVEEFRAGLIAQQQAAPAPGTRGPSRAAIAKMLRRTDAELSGRYNGLSPEEVAARPSFAFKDASSTLDAPGSLDPWKLAFGFATEQQAKADLVGNRAGRIGGLWHGTPHDFEKFLISAIGTGEGAQVYGHGLYFTDQKWIGEQYRDTLTRRIGGPIDFRGATIPAGEGAGDAMLASKALSANERSALLTAKRALSGGVDDGFAWDHSFEDGLDYVIDEARFDLTGLDGSWRDEAQRYLDGLLSIRADMKRAPGKLYKVAFDATDDDLIHWDLPLWEQPPKVKEMLRGIPEVHDEVLDWESPRMLTSDIAEKLGIQNQAQSLHKAITDYADSYHAINDVIEDGTPEAAALVRRIGADLRKAKEQIAWLVGEANAPEVLRRLDVSNHTAMVELLEEGVDNAGDLVKWMGQLRTPSAASQEFRARGIKGIKYANGVTRNATNKAKEFNYVAFDDTLVEILEKGALGARSGNGALPIMGGIAGGVAGGAYGYAQGDTPEERAAMGVAGALAGAAGGAGLGKLGDAAGNALHPRTGDVTALAPDGRRGALGVGQGRETPQPQGPANPRVKHFAKLHTFTVDPTGQARLAAEVSKVIEEGDPGLRTVVTHEQTRRTAKEIGLDAKNLQFVSGKRLNGAEMLAIRNLVTTNAEDIGAAFKDIEAIRVASGGNPTKEQLTELDALERFITGAEKQNDALIHTFVKARSQTGRDLNNMAILANRVDEPFFWYAKAAKYLGEEGWKKKGAAMRSQIDALIAAKDTEGLIQLLAKNRTSSNYDKALSFWKANLLTNLLTHSVNVTSNTVMLGMENVKDGPAAVADWLMGLATKGRTVAAPGVTQLSESFRGAAAGLREAKHILKGGLNSDALSKYDIPRRVNYDNKLVDTYVNTVFNLLGAEDRVFRSMAYRGSIANQAKAATKNKAARAKLIAEPSDDMVARAIADAEEATFQDKTVTGHVLSTIGSKPGLGFLIPFTKTPGAVAHRIAEYSPVGAIVGGVKVGSVIAKALAGKSVSEQTQREAARLFGRGVTGTGIVGLGYFLAANGLMRGSTDASANTERDTNALLGQVDGGISIGDQVLDITRIAPLGHLLLLGANLYGVRSDPDKPGPIAQVAAGGASLARSVLDQPFLQGVENFLKAKDDPQGKVAQQMLWNIGGGFVPASAALGGVARAIDPQFRGATSFPEFLQSRLPVASKGVPGQLDQFGAPATRESGALGVLNALVSPARVTGDRTAGDPLKDEIARLGLTVSKRKKSGEATEADITALVADEGPAIRAALEQVMAMPSYKAADKWQQAAALESTVTRVRSGFSRKHQLNPTRVEKLREKYGVN